MGSFLALAVTAATLGFVHTALGPDHYLPFVVLSRARGRSAARSERLTVTFGRMGRFSHAAAGLVVMACGGAITFLGL